MLAGKSAGKARSNAGKVRDKARRARAPWINNQLIAAANTGNVETLLSSIDAFLPEMNLVNISTALHRLARNAVNDKSAQTLAHARKVPSRLAAAARVSIKRCVDNGAVPASQALSNATWSLAALKTVDLELLRVVLAVADTHIAIFKPFELSSMLWAIAKLSEEDAFVRIRGTSFLTSAARVIKERPSDFSYRCLVMCAWAFATLSVPDDVLFRRIAAQIVQSVAAASCSEVAQMAWAFGTAAIRDDALFAEITKFAVKRLRSFEAQDLSDLLSGCSAVGFLYDSHLVEAAAELGVRVPRDADNNSSDEVAIAGWVCTVKNTFIEVDDGETTCPSSDEELVLLKPSLDLIPQDAISPEKLTAYRLEYQRFRAGGALGAKGELCSSVM